MSSADLGAELCAAFAGLATRPPGPIRVEGEDLTPVGLARRVFGAGAMVWARTPDDRTPRWFETSVIVHIDSAWHTAEEITAIAARLHALETSVRLTRLDESRTGLGWRIQVVVVGERAPDPAPEPRTSVGSSSYRPREDDELHEFVCPSCGARHHIHIPRRTSGVAYHEREEYDELCLRCGRTPFYFYTVIDYFIEVLPDGDNPYRSP